MQFRQLLNAASFPTWFQQLSALRVSVRISAPTLHDQSMYAARRVQVTVVAPRDTLHNNNQSL
jgi:hypothetical protein